MSENTLETLFRELPSDLQNYIIRKARFLEAKARLHHWLATSHQRIRWHKYVQFHQVTLRINDVKTMHIKMYASFLRDHIDTLTVDVHDSSKLGVYLFVMGNNKIALYISYIESVEHAVTDGIVQPPVKVYIVHQCR